MLSLSSCSYPQHQLFPGRRCFVRKLTPLTMHKSEVFPLWRFMRWDVIFGAPLLSVTPLSALSHVLAPSLCLNVCSPSLSCRHFKRLLMLTLEAAVLHVRVGEAKWSLCLAVSPRSTFLQRRHEWERIECDGEEAAGVVTEPNKDEINSETETFI